MKVYVSGTPPPHLKKKKKRFFVIVIFKFLNRKVFLILMFWPSSARDPEILVYACIWRHTPSYTWNFHIEGSVFKFSKQNHLFDFK